MSRKWIWLILAVAALAGFWFWKSPPGSASVLPPRNSGPIVAFGDSLTYGYGAPSGQGYVDVLSQMLARPIVNKGVPGNTIGNAHARIDRDVLQLKPSIVIMLLGGNDYLRNHDMNAALNELDEMVGTLQTNGAMVVLVGMEGLIPFSGYGKRFESIATARRAVFVPDILDGIIGRRDLMYDEIHPNAAGYRIMAERVAAKLRPHVN